MTPVCRWKENFQDALGYHLAHHLKKKVNIYIIHLLIKPYFISMLRGLRPVLS